MVRIKVITRYGEFISAQREGNVHSAGDMFNDMSEVVSLTFYDDAGSRYFIPQAVISESIIVLFRDDDDL